MIAPRGDRALERYARRKTGMPFPGVPYFTPAPWLARAIVDLHPEYGLLMHLDFHEMDIWRSWSVRKTRAATAMPRFACSFGRKE